MGMLDVFWWVVFVLWLTMVALMEILTKPKASKIQTEDSEIDIIKGEKLKYYSVADELIKWAKLKEDGLISENEFNEARAKILKRN